MYVCLSTGFRQQVSVGGARPVLALDGQFLSLDTHACMLLAVCPWTYHGCRDQVWTTGSTPKHTKRSVTDRSAQPTRKQTSLCYLHPVVVCKLYMASSQHRVRRLYRLRKADDLCHDRRALSQLQRCICKVAPSIFFYILP